MSNNDTVKSPTIPTPNSMVSPTQNDQRENKVKLSWNDQTETLLRSWSDISSCYNWMHDKSFRKYQKKNFKFSLPVIILSTLTGTLNLALQGYVPADYITYAQAGIGGVNIFTGILTTLQNYFRYAENSESHRNASVGWGKLQRNISIELTYDRLSRKDADSFIKVCRMEYDRLLEQSPIIPTEIISLFKKKYAEQRKQKKKQKENKKQQRKMSKSNNNNKDDNEEFYEDDDNDDDKLILPDVCGELTHTGVYKESLNECTRLDKMLDIKQSEESRLIPEIKDVLLDRLSILEEKLTVSHTPRMEYKPLHEYSLEELQLALDRKDISNIARQRANTINSHTENFVQHTIQKNLEPLNLNIRRLSEQLQKPTLNRVNTTYMADIPIRQQTSRDFSFKDLMKKFEITTTSPMKEIKNETIINNNNKNIEIIENKNLETIENKNLENKKNEVIININEKLNDLDTVINTNIENNEKVLQKADNDSLEVNNNIVENIIVKTDEVVNQGFENVVIDIINKNVEAGQPLLDLIEKEINRENVLEPNIDIKEKPKKNKVELIKGNLIGKSQKKLNTFFMPVKTKEEESIIMEEESIKEESLSSEPSTFEISINENGEESIKLNFIDTDDEDEKK
uniref:SMODS and SLOG-associating 2TM effector domain-containing protein n=1 Tax=viral metagenome TaxID=1070528 RepID=A0A6C0HE74_9ZZZZ